MDDNSAGTGCAIALGIILAAPFFIAVLAVLQFGDRGGGGWIIVRFFGLPVAASFEASHLNPAAENRRLEAL